MTKVRLTIEADQSKLFDSVAQMQRGGGDGTEGVGIRVVSMLLDGKINSLTSLGLAVYGISVVSLDKIE